MRRALEVSPIFGRRTRARVEAPAAAANDDDDDDDDDLAFGDIDVASLPDDTLAALLLLRRQFPSLALPRFPPVVLLHQLYTVVASRTDVDRAIEQARQAKTVTKFVLPVTARASQYLLLLWRDFEVLVGRASRQLAQAATPPPGVRSDVFDRFVRLMRGVETDVAIGRAKLAEEMGATEEEIAFLVRSGFMTLRDGSSLWFSVPQLGSYVVQLTNGRSDVLAILRRRKFHEIAERVLVRKRLRRSQLGWEYHLSDLAGTQDIELKHTSEGNLVRLAGAALHEAREPRPR